MKIGGNINFYEKINQAKNFLKFDRSFDDVERWRIAAYFMNIGVAK